MPSRGSGLRLGLGLGLGIGLEIGLGLGEGFELRGGGYPAGGTGNHLRSGSPWCGEGVIIRRWAHGGHFFFIVWGRVFAQEIPAFDGEVCVRVHEVGMFDKG